MTTAKHAIETIAKSTGSYAFADNVPDVRPYLTGRAHDWKERYEPGLWPHHFLDDQGDNYFLHAYAKYQQTNSIDLSYFPVFKTKARGDS